ncbi:MAG: hypothetical protein R3324_10430, partial [Halobacteriales archaeon]|nr:hypothetical protein [Halobacteriales archaeon]
MTFEIYERAGALHVARDVGKPEGSLYRTGGDAPRFTDNRAGLELFTVVGQLTGSGAYADARTLAEDIVRPHSGGTNATLDLSDVVGLGIYDVAFIGEAPVRLGYERGQGEWVSVQLTAARVDNTIGGSTLGDAGSAGSGSGPVTLARGSGSALTLADNLEMERAVGRPATQLRYDADSLPYAVDRLRAYSDVFTLSGLWRTSAGATQATLVDAILKPRLGYGTLTLDFNGMYGLGSYSVAPVGSR